MFELIGTDGKPYLAAVQGRIGGHRPCARRLPEAYRRRRETAA